MALRAPLVRPARRATQEPTVEFSYVTAGGVLLNLLFFCSSGSKGDKGSDGTDGTNGSNGAPGSKGKFYAVIWFYGAVIS